MPVQAVGARIGLPTPQPAMHGREEGSPLSLKELAHFQKGRSPSIEDHRVPGEGVMDHVPTGEADLINRSQLLSWVAEP